MILFRQNNTTVLNDGTATEVQTNYSTTQRVFKNDDHDADVTDDTATEVQTNYSTPPPNVMFPFYYRWRNDGGAN